MKDYTAVFSEAIRQKAGYNPGKLRRIINALPGVLCGDPDAWAEDHWQMLLPDPPDYAACYGHLSAEYPVALLTEHCPAGLRQLLEENGILCTELAEPMSCEENVLKQFLPHKLVLDERFMDAGDFSEDDDRFFQVLQRLETGHQEYVDAGSFTMAEIR